MKTLDLTGNVSNKVAYGAVLSLAFPAIIEQIMLTMVQYIDTAMVGSLGANATAAIGLTSSTTWLFGGFMGAMGVGFSVQVAQYVGAKRTKEAKDVIWQALFVNLVFGLFLLAVGTALSYPLPRWLGGAPEVVGDASKYFLILACAFPFLLTSNIFSAVIRCTGDTKTPMILNIMINLINIVLNLFFIFPTKTHTVLGFSFTMPGFGLGVIGAAIASAIAETTVAILLLVVLFFKKTPWRLSFKDKFHINGRVIKTAVTLGIPVALERSAVSLAHIVITAIVSHISTIAVAANYLATTAESLCYAPGYGIASASTALVGQAIGAKNERVARRFAWLTTGIGIGIMSVLGIIMYIYAPQLISIFSNEPEVIALGIKVLRIEAFAEPLFAASIVATGALRGAGDSKWPFFINMGCMWAVRIVVALILTPYFGLVGAWIGMCADLCCRGIIFLVRLGSKKWSKKALIED